MTQEEWDEYHRLEERIPAGGNDGADIEEYLSYQRALEAKYDKHINLILEDFLKDKYKD